jgi:hypothetical protein
MSSSLSAASSGNCSHRLGNLVGVETNTGTEAGVQFVVGWGDAFAQAGGPRLGHQTRARLGQLPMGARFRQAHGTGVPADVVEDEPADPYGRIGGKAGFIAIDVEPHDRRVQTEVTGVDEIVVIDVRPAIFGRDGHDKFAVAHPQFAQCLAPFAGAFGIMDPVQKRAFAGFIQIWQIEYSP